MIKKYNENDIQDIVSKIDLKGKSGIFIHSSIYRMGFPEDPSKIMKLWLNNFERFICSEATIGVPTFNFDFCKGTPYSKDTTRSQMGVFSEYFRNNNMAFRTNHPINSCAFIGKEAESLSKIDSNNCYSKEGVFQKMLNKNFDILLLGATFQSISFVHLAEFTAKVRYRYIKSFRGKCLNSNSDKMEIRSYEMFVRNLNFNPILKLEKVKNYMLNKDPNSVKILDSNSIKNIILINSNQFVDACTRMLIENEFSLLEDSRNYL